MSYGESYIMYLCNTVSTPCSVVVDLFKCLHCILLAGTGSFLTDFHVIMCSDIHLLGDSSQTGFAGTGIPLEESMATNQSHGTVVQVLCS